jgi:hypothetical protein
LAERQKEEREKILKQIKMFLKRIFFYSSKVEGTKALRLIFFKK